MSEEKSISLSDLKQILADQARQNAEQLATVIQELKKPTVLEQQQLDREKAELLAKNEERKANAQGQKQILAEKRAIQRICSHKHARTGDSHCVFIHERSGPGYLLCQKNQCIIRPGVQPKENYNGTDIYDTALFNRILQEMPSNELFG